MPSATGWRMPSILLLLLDIQTARRFSSRLRTLHNPMGRKSKQTGGHLPLTHYERTKKFASSGYGTNTQRVAKESQYHIGQCALTTQRLEGDTALCSPSGNLYSESAILEYLLKTTQSLKKKRAEYEQEAQQGNDGTMKKEDAASRKRLADFKESQETIRKMPKPPSGVTAREDLTRVSYWLAAAQPQKQQPIISSTATPTPPPERPSSPITGAPLRRKDLWPVHLKRNDDDILVCAVSGQSLERGNPSVMAYWTDRKKMQKHGTLALASVLGDVVDRQQCPLTDRKIQQVRTLHASGAVTYEGKYYKPTIT